MRRREFLIIMALLTVALASTQPAPAAIDRNDTEGEQGSASGVESNNDSEPVPIEMIPVEPSPLIVKDKKLGAAYFNTLSILGGNNSCSDFFGGPKAAVKVFNQLVSKMKRDYFPSTIGIQMSGAITSVSDVMTNREYRLFDKVRINTEGPFYRRRMVNTLLPRIGSFEPNTSEIRVLMFLHELGHVIKAEDGTWLLADDGEDDELSRLNSRKIENICGAQIKDIGKKNESKVWMTLKEKLRFNASGERGKASPTSDKISEQADELPILKEN